MAKKNDKKKGKMSLKAKRRMGQGRNKAHESASSKGGKNKN